MSSVSPSWLIATMRSALGGASTASSAWIESPEVCAAWNDVPQPVTTTRPSGKPPSAEPLGDAGEPLRLGGDRRAHVLSGSHGP